MDLRLMRIIWILAVWTCAYGQQMRIPHQLESMFKNATTFAELEQRMRVRPSTRSNFPSGQSTYNRARGGGIGGVSPSAGRARSGSVSSFPTSGGGGGGSGSVIENPIQAQDSCKIVNICVPLPVEERTGVYLFPRCVDLARCMGGCCQGGYNCHAVDSQIVRVKYKQWLITEESGVFEMITDDYIEMQQHKTCGCNQCTEDPVCNSKQEAVNCQCQCKNREAKAACQGANQRWSEEKCECTCNRVCPASSFLNKTTCSCEPIRSFDTPSNTSPDDGDNDDDDEDDHFERMRRDQRRGRERNVHLERRPSYSPGEHQRRHHHGGRPRH